jgi:O-antigen/teichoic acid export membrane protein
LAFFVLSSILYWLFLGLFHGPIIAWLYGGQYEESANLLWFLGLLPVCAGVGAVLGAALRAFERPDRAFWAYVFSALVSMLGLVMVFTWGVAGAAAGLLVSSVVTAGATTYFFVSMKETVGGGANHR